MREELKDGALGRAVIEPSDEVIAAHPGTWRITHTVGARALADGACVRVTIPYGFTPPQAAYHSGLGLVMAETSRQDATVTLHLEDPAGVDSNQSTWGLKVYAALAGAGLEPGETLSITYGTGMSEGAYARYFEGEAEFTVAVDPDGRRAAPHGGFVLVDDPQPRLRIVADEPASVFAVLPSIARQGEPLNARLTVRDRHGNSVTGFGRAIALTGANPEPACHTFTPADAGRAELMLDAPAEGGVIRVTAADDRGARLGTSNPCRVTIEAPSERLYWGDIHVMTEISAGLRRPAEALAYARDHAHLDFCAITDGDDADNYFADAEWEETTRAVRRYHAPGRFVTLLASEYHERQVAGEKNIYYREDDAPLLRWSDLEGAQPEALWKALAGRKAMTVPHHVTSGTAGRRPWEHHDPEHQRLVEIYSVWGSGERDGCERRNFWRHDVTNSVQSALAKGYRLGIVASGDSHEGMPGNSRWLRLRPGYPSGIVGVYSAELTREGIFDAMWDRRCYGTTGARIILSFSVNDAPMGGELSGDEHRALRRLHVEVTGTAPIAELTVVRNGREFGLGAGDEAGVWDWQDEQPFGEVALPGFDGRPFIYYYLRVRQTDGELAWSSPVWVV